MPSALLDLLGDHHDLGIHTELISDGVVDLVESGAATGLRKTTRPGKVVGTFALGTTRTYEFLADNPVVEMLPVDWVNDPRVIGREQHFVSINGTVEVDFLGQCNSEVIGGRYWSGSGGQADFARGAMHSAHGQGFVVLHSTGGPDHVSRIVPSLSAGAAVTTDKNTVDKVVTEYGVAELRGRSIDERTRALIAISHPEHRDALERAAGDRRDPTRLRSGATRGRRAPPSFGFRCGACSAGEVGRGGDRGGCGRGGRGRGGGGGGGGDEGVGDRRAVGGGLEDVDGDRAGAGVGAAVVGLGHGAVRRAVEHEVLGAAGGAEVDVLVVVGGLALQGGLLTTMLSVGGAMLVQVRWMTKVVPVGAVPTTALVTVSVAVSAGRVVSVWAPTGVAARKVKAIVAIVAGTRSLAAERVRMGFPPPGGS